MRKCPKCGYLEIYWRPLPWDPEEEYCQLSNFPEAKEWAIGKVVEMNGFAYWRKRTRKGHEEYVSRLALEEYRARGNRKRGKGSYYESKDKIAKIDLEIFNQKLADDGKHRLKVNQVPEATVFT
jgi:hypothetical protein